MSENQVSRKSLVAAIALVALHGLRDRTIQEYRHFNKDGNANQQPRVKHIADLLLALSRGRVLRTEDSEVLAVLAFAQQTARVSTEEWETVVQIRRNDA
jgi:hypothetical protein